MEPTQIEKNGPTIAAEIQAAGLTTQRYTAVALTYDRKNNAIKSHRTLAAAFRSLGSMCNSSRGKLNRRDFFAAAIVTPSGRVMNWTEAKQVLSLKKTVTF